MTLRYDCSTFDRSQVAGHYKTDTRLRDYIDERKEDTEVEEKVPIPRSLQGAVLLFFAREREREGERSFFQPLMEQKGGEGEMVSEKMKMEGGFVASASGENYSREEELISLCVVSFKRLFANL